MMLASFTHATFSSPTHAFQACLFVVPRDMKTKVLHGRPMTSIAMGTNSNIMVINKAKPSSDTMSCFSLSAKSKLAPGQCVRRINAADIPPVPQKMSAHLL